VTTPADKGEHTANRTRERDRDRKRGNLESRGKRKCAARGWEEEEGTLNIDQMIGFLSDTWLPGLIYLNNNKPKGKTMSPCMCVCM